MNKFELILKEPFYVLLLFFRKVYFKISGKKIYIYFISSYFERLLIYLDRINSMRGEKKLARKIIHDNFSYKNFPFYNQYEQRVNFEIKNLQLRKSSKVLFVGGGAVPLTAILLSKDVGCRVDCYEFNKCRALLGRQVIDKINAKGIMVHRKDGINAETNGYSHIYISATAEPQIRLLRKFLSSKDARASQKILCRSLYNSIGKKIDDLFMQCFFKYWSCSKHSSPNLYEEIRIFERK